MATDWIGMAKDLRSGLREMRVGAPEVMKAFAGIAQAALATKALDAKTKELIALAISVAVRCDDCIAFHAKAAVDQGATSDEILETLGMAIYMGAGPSAMYAAHALQACRQFAEAKAAEGAGAASQQTPTQ
jgi:AhpD family alkylhydroperoxidase